MKIKRIEQPVRPDMLSIKIHFNDLLPHVQYAIIAQWNEENATDWTIEDFSECCLGDTPIAMNAYEIDSRQ